LAQKTKIWKTEKKYFFIRRMEEQHLATEETNENMEKDKIIDNGNIFSWYNCHCNCSGELL
jgi:hypothetical protein